MKPEEQLLLALGDVGDDLIEEAMHLRFPRAQWFRALPMAACCALILGAALLLQNLELLRESQITLPEGEDTVQEVLPPDTEAETTSRPFYVLNLDDDLYGAKQAVDQDGTVLVEVEQGKLYPLEDQSTGEVLAIAARDHLELGTPSDSPIVLYDLQGQLFTTLGAQYIACTGEVVAVIRSTGYELYRRSDGSLLTQGTGTVDLRGDFALCTDVDLGLCSLYNADGQLAAQFPSDRYDGGLLEWDGQFYFAVAGESGQLGLMDSHGTWVLEPVYEAITALALNRAVVSRDGEFQVISLETGEAVFTWPYHIYQIHAEGYVVEMADGWEQAVDLDGRPVSALAYRVELVDDNRDGQAELLAEVQMEGYQVIYRCNIPPHRRHAGPYGKLRGRRADDPLLPGGTVPAQRRQYRIPPQSGDRREDHPAGPPIFLAGAGRGLRRGASLYRILPGGGRRTAHRSPQRVRRGGPGRHLHQRHGNPPG